MRLRPDALKQWAENIQPHPSSLTWKKIAEQARFSLVTVMRQKSKGAMDPQIVLEISRRWGRDPLVELGQFPGYEALAQAPDQFPTTEILTQIPPELILQEVWARLGGQPPEQLQIPGWGQFPYAFSSWISAMGPRDYNAAIRSVLGVSDSAVAKKITTPQFKVEEVVVVCVELELNARLALLILGHITEGEARIDPNLRESALKYSSGEELIEQIHHVERFMRRRLQISESVAEAYETLT